MRTKWNAADRTVQLHTGKRTTVLINRVGTRSMANIPMLPLQRSKISTYRGQPPKLRSTCCLRLPQPGPVDETLAEAIITPRPYRNKTSFVAKVPLNFEAIFRHDIAKVKALLQSKHGRTISDENGKLSSDSSFRASPKLTAKLSAGNGARLPVILIKSQRSSKCAFYDPKEKKMLFAEQSRLGRTNSLFQMVLKRSLSPRGVGVSIARRKFSESPADL